MGQKHLALPFVHGSCTLETVQDFFVQVEHEITHLLEIIPFSVYISSSDLTHEQS